MRIEQTTRHVKSAWLCAGLAFVMFLGVPADQAVAGCTNYGDYLHWISTFQPPGAPSGIDVQGSYAYLAENGTSGGHLLVLDMTNESLPVVVGSATLPGNALDVAVHGTTAVVPNSDPPLDGLYLLDISNPTAPSIIGSTIPGRRCMKVVIANSIAYVTSYSPSHSLEVVDISDPANPVMLTSVPLPSQATGGLVVSGSYVYVTAGSFVTVDVSVPATAHVVDTESFLNRSVRDVAVSGNYAYLSTRHATENSDLWVYSLANPAQPQPVGRATNLFPGGAYYPYVAYAAGVCYYGFDHTNILMIDVRNPVLPHVDGFLPHYGSYLQKLTIRGPNLYNLGSWPPSYQTGAVHITSVSSPSPMEPIGTGFDTPGDARSVVVSGTRNALAYVADGASGLQIVDVTNPLSPQLVGSVDTPGFATDIVLSGTTAYVADGGSGLQVIDVAAPQSPQIVGSVDTPGSAVDLAVVDTLIYIADTGGGLRIANVATPSAPVIIGVEDGLTSAVGVDVSGGIAFMANGSSGVSSVDVSDPNNPWIIGGVKTRSLGNALKIDVTQSRAYVTDQDSGLVIIDISDPEALQILSGLETENTASDVNVMGIFAYVGSGAGVELVDIQEPSSPRMVGNVTVPANSQGIFVNEFYAYVAAGSAGLQVCPTQCGFDGTVIAGFVPSVSEGFYPITIQFNNQSIGYGLSYDWNFGDGSAHSTERHPTHIYTQPGDYTVTLTATNGVNTDVVSSFISALAEPPTITSITDVPGDQGGFVYVRFYHSGYDTGDLNRAELYTIQRMDAGQWVGITTVGAYGEHYYTALANTQSDGQEWTAQFRVIAHMDEGNWASASAIGFSIDNIAPQVPAHLTWQGAGLLAWDPPAEDDFAHHTVYGSASAEFDETATLIDYTVDPGLDVSGTPFAYYHVSTTDDAGNESGTAGIVNVGSSAPGEASLPDRFSLHPARPNPFRGGTTIGFDLPRAADVRLTIFDAAGRQVRTIAEGGWAAGRHRVAWQGRDDSGRRVSAGAYFARLVAGGEVFTRRVLLVR